MPLYIDTHEGTDLPTELRETVRNRVRTGERDAAGVIDRGVLIDKDAKKMHCILDAPDVNAVMKHHEMLKVPLERDTIHQADAILK